MNVMLIVPPDTLSIEASMSKTFGERERGYYPKLGILYVAGYLEKHTGRPPIFVDCPANGIGYDELAHQIADAQPDLVGIGVLTFCLLDALKVARLVKKVHPPARVCFGGVHAGLYPEETLRLPEVDFVVHGEGERAFTRLVQALEAGASKAELKRIPGVGYRMDGDFYLNPEKDLPESLDDLPFPARHLISMERYSHVLARGNQFSTLQSSRGCPFACTFCDIRKSGFRARTPENVVAEIRHMAEQGVDELFFVDDTITVQKKRLHDLCRAIIKSGLSIYYKISARVDTVTPELLADLKQSGCYRIHYGVETANPRLLKYMEKGVTPEQVSRAFRMTKEAGIQALAYMMIGIPTETRAEMQETIDFAISLDADYAQFSVCTPYPKTELYRRLLADGTIPYDYWQAFVENPQPEFRVKFWNPDFEEAELRAVQDRAHQRFYRRPSYMLKELMKVRSLAEFNAKVRMGGRILLKLRGPAVSEPPDMYVNTGS
jgi:anaerobic magnesium-protoporphyrin IX monomethyl ester cyclase